MIYLKKGNIPLNFAFDDEIIQEANSTYQLTFKFPVNDSLFGELKEEVLLLADDLHGEQEFIIFEIVNNHGYCTVYANQVASLLNSYSVSEINVDRVSGYRAMSELAGSIIRDNDFSLFSDIDDKHTLNLKNTSAMSVLAKDKHSIIGQWGGDLVRDKYDIRLLKNGGSENESLFMYKKNMKSYTQNKSIKELRTRIHFRRKKDNTEEFISVTVDSPLINKYQNIYEYDMEVNDQDVTDLRTLTEYGKKYFRETLCDVIEESIEIDVVGVNDIDVRIFDVVSIFHEKFGVDIRKKITKYRYSPMGKKLKSIGFGKVQQGLSSAISGIVNEEVTHQTRNIHSDIDARVEKELKNADLAFDRKVENFQQSINDMVELNKVKVEEQNEALREELNSKIETEATKNQELIDDFKQTFDGEKQELLTNINSVSTDVNSKLESANRKIEENRNEATRLTNEVREEANNLGRNINELRSNVEQTNRGLREDITRINQKFDNAGNLVELARYKTEREATDRDMTTKITELQLYKDGEAERTAVIENKIIESARGTEQKISETYSNIGLNYFRNTKTFGGDWYVKWAWVLESETNNGFAVMSRNGSWHGVSQSVYSEAEQWWTYSFDLKAVDVSSVAIYTTHGAGSATVTVGDSNQINVTNEFARYSHTFKVGTAGIIRPRVERTANSGKIYISKIKLEKGRIATPWTPHVDDNETYTSDRLVTINNSLDGIRTTITGVDRRVSDVNSNLNTYKSEREQTDRATREQLTALNTYMNADGTRQTNILSLAERKTAELLSREMTNVSQNYVANSVLTETVNGINRKFSEIKIGGRNYIRDYGSFARGVTSSISSDWKYELINDNQAKSGKCVKLTALKNNHGPWLGGFDFLKNQEFQNKQMTWSLDIKSNKTFTTNKIGFETGGLTTKTITTEFQRIHHTFINKFTTWWSFVVYGYTFSQGDVIYIRDPQLEDGSVPTSPRPAPEDNIFNIDSKIAEYRQTVDGQIAAVRGIANDGKALATRVEQDLAGVRTNVSSLSGDVFKKSEYRQTDDKITLATGYEIDGRKLGSILSLSPDGIRAVTDKLTITADNENLIPHHQRSIREMDAKYMWFSTNYTHELKGGDEFLFEADATILKDGAHFTFCRVGIFVNYNNGTSKWFSEGFLALGGQQLNRTELKKQHSIKIPEGEILENIKYWKIGLYQEHDSTFGKFKFENIKLYKKKSAELIVDGSITAKHLDTNSVRTGILTANSIKSTMLDSDVILAKHLKVDEAMIDKLMLNDLLVDKIIAKEALVNKIKATTIDASKITSGTISADRIKAGTLKGFTIEGGTINGGIIKGNTKIKIGDHGFLKPAETGLHICSPETASATSGVGLQILGNTGRNNKSPYGVFIYKDPNFYSTKTEHTTSYLLTVNGYINADGIGNLKLTNYTDGSAGISLWSGKRPELIFKDVGNDIIYSWNGVNYGLWGLITSYYDTSSDIRIKRNVKDSKLEALNLVEKLSFKEFDYIEHDIFKGRHVNNGLIAQDIQKLDESLVYYKGDILSIDSFKMLNIALKAIQELTQENKSMKEEIKLLKEKAS